VLGENENPDHIVEDIPVFSRVIMSSGETFGFSGPVFVSWNPMAFSSSLQPIPEPDTWALLLTGLAAFTLRQRAQRKS